jgi:hypothetical protein
MSNSSKASIQDTPDNGGDLGKQYREIGISAVVAALPYIGEQKKQAYTPAKPKVLTLRDLELLIS